MHIDVRHVKYVCSAICYVKAGCSYYEKGTHVGEIKSAQHHLATAAS